MVPVSGKPIPPEQRQMQWPARRKIPGWETLVESSWGTLESLTYRVLRTLGCQYMPKGLCSGYLSSVSIIKTATEAHKE